MDSFRASFLGLFWQEIGSMKMVRIIGISNKKQLIVPKMD